MIATDDRCEIISALMLLLIPTVTLTSPVRTAATAPDFIIVGAMKAGTTTLTDVLSSHPDVLMAEGEGHYFNSCGAVALNWNKVYHETCRRRGGEAANTWGLECEARSSDNLTAGCSQVDYSARLPQRTHPRQLVGEKTPSYLAYCKAREHAYISRTLSWPLACDGRNSVAPCVCKTSCRLHCLC